MLKMNAFAGRRPAATLTMILAPVVLAACGGKPIAGHASHMTSASTPTSSAAASRDYSTTTEREWSTSTHLSVQPTYAAPTTTVPTTTWTQYPLQTKEPATDRIAEDGVYEPGLDIIPGTYSTDGGTACHWNRTGERGVLLESNRWNETGPQTVTILASDVSFSTVGCGIWTRTGQYS